MQAEDYGFGYCQCGCDRKTNIAAKTNRAQGQVKGQPSRFLPGHKKAKHPDYLLEDRGYTTACWIWQGGKDRLGYGLVKRPEHQGVAHVWYYKKFKGPIPEGMELDHLCRVRECVNPDHFEAVTHAENLRRGISPTAINARKTHCVHGHEFTPENTFLRADTGHRECRTCKRQWHRDWYRRQKAKGAGP